MEKGFYTIENKAIRKYGITKVAEFAGYLLKDGRMLDFSHEGRQRDVDHRDIMDVYSSSHQDTSGTAYMYKFIRRGNIRCSCNSCCYGFECSTVPTWEQWQTLKSLRKDAHEMGLDFIIEQHMSNGSLKRFAYRDFVRYINPKVPYYVE